MSSMLQRYAEHPVQISYHVVFILADDSFSREKARFSTLHVLQFCQSIKSAVEIGQSISMI